MGIVSTIPEKCKRCYTCVRECPAKAIKVEGGQAMVIEERCIACGNCVKVCAQKAKRIEDSTVHVRRMLAEADRVFACLAPSFPAALDHVSPGKIVAAVRALGFDEVWEVAFGAELISNEYAKLFADSRNRGTRVVASPCPAIIAFVEKYVPSLHDALAPIVSPMIAVARAIRQRHGAGVRIVFVGPCIAKKNEIRDPCIAGTVDYVLTYEELLKMFDESAINPDRLPESTFDSPNCSFGRSFPISGGLLKTSGLSTDILGNDIVITEGKDRVLAAIQELSDGKSQARFFDVLFCEGCINGPLMLNDLSVFARKEMVADFVNEQRRRVTREEVGDALAEFDGLDLSRGFTSQNLALREPTEEEIAEALRTMKKVTPEDQLNCGACGYRSCRDKAVAVCQGLAEPAMCLPYLVEELEATCQRLQRSHEELACAQQRLVQTERLASMGQLSAAVAHEVNNPLGTVLLYSHMLLKQMQDRDPGREDVQMIVSEASRCKEIIRGLLDFARQSRVSKEPTELAEVIDEVMSIMSPKADAAGINLASEVEDGVPNMLIDKTQIRQMFVNLVQNGIDATAPGGEVKISAHLSDRGDAVDIEVSDNGCGIPEENLEELFTPFFTTKEVGKGTGLGLAIAYGIVKMHSGDISAQSEEGKGSTFCIRLPLTQQESSGVYNPGDRRVQALT